MKYIIIQIVEDQVIKLTRPATETQARNSLERFRNIGITNIQVVPTNRIPKLEKGEETSEEFLMAKKDFEAAV